VDQDRLSGFLLVLFAGPFDEFSVGERRSGADQGDEMRRVDPRASGLALTRSA
jgi:hypothetical protein